VGGPQRPAMTRPSSTRDGSFEPETPDVTGSKVPKPPAPEFAVPAPKPPKPEKKELRLANFLAKHTSEDNEAFEEILDKDAKALTEKRIWLAEQQDQADKLKLLHEDPKRTGVITTWEYKTINHLLFYPEGNYVDPNSTISRGPEKEIILQNTRFPGGFFDKPKEGEVSAAVAAAKSGEAGGSGSTPALNGYKFLRTPSPAPGSGGESPMMTWGDIIGTPLRLEEDDAEQSAKAKAARFKLPDTPDREVVGRKLDENVMIKNRFKKKRKQLLTTPSPARTPGRTPVSLSPAAMKLLKAKRASLMGSDSQLRASYHSPALFPSANRSKQMKSNIHTPFAISSLTPPRTPAQTPTPIQPTSPEFTY